MAAPSHRLRIATRGSALALWQARHVAGLLVAADPDLVTELVVVDTTADKRLDLPIAAIGGKGVFVKEIQAAVLDGRADVAVHSGKDLPSVSVDGLRLAAVPERGDPRDALVGSTLATLPAGARIGTGSIRRRVQLANMRPDLTFGELRGNMARRLERADDFDAVVVAAVALQRLGLADRLTEVLDVTTMLPQVAQGALAVECREDVDADLRAALTAVDDPVSRLRVEAERGFLSVLGGDCNLPAGAHAVVLPNQTLRVDALLASLDGRVVLRHRAEGGLTAADGLASIPDKAPTVVTPETAASARDIGASAAHHLLEDAGGRALLLG